MEKEGRKMSRKRIIAGNWKMNKTPEEAVALVEQLKPLVDNAEAEVVVCVPAIDILPVVKAVSGSSIAVGAQNMHFEESGAYTGEISPSMLVQAGVTHVILGHSERRTYFAETNETVNKKLKKALEHGLVPIICCGESLEQREQGITMDWIRQQIKAAFQGITPEQAEKTVIAYEPIWAIGTGKVATASQAQEVCKEIRDCMQELYGRDTAQTVRIQYGGSVSEGSAEELFNQPDIDGGLVGGASLKAEFGNIVNCN